MTSRSSTPSAHSVHLFDSKASRVAGMCRFVREAFEHGNSALVVATPAHWRAAATALEREGIEVDAAIADGRLTVLNAADTLSGFMRGNAPDPDKLEAIVGTLVARLAERPGRLHIYGEMVDVLAEAGNFRAAHRLEELWNGFAARTPITLFCGYTSAHFGDPRAALALRAICDAHSHVHTAPADELGTFLTTQARQVSPRSEALPGRFTPEVS